ncbi:hypothetical protein Aperf_G00000058894 [Anoplocephala perfoliata]
MDPTWKNFLDQLDPLLNKNDDSVISKLSKKYYATSYKFQNNPRTPELLQDIIRRIRAWPLDLYSILLELKLILSKNKRDPAEAVPNSRSSYYSLRESAPLYVLEGETRLSDKPSQPRRVSFITLSDTPQPRNEDREDSAITSGSRKRPHSKDIPDRISGDVPASNRRSLAKIRDNDGINYHKLRFLERTMLHISQKIEELEVADSDLNEENSSYLRLDSLKRRYLSLWREFCRLRGANDHTARLDRQAFRYNKSRFSEINQGVEHLIKTSHCTPDYSDIRTMVEKVAAKASLPLGSPQKMDQEARKIFIDVVQQLKKRREDEFQRDLFHLPGVDQTDADDDPALHDAELRDRLKKNELMAVSKLKSVMAKYCRLQEEEEKGTVDVDSMGSKPSARGLSSEDEVEEPLPISVADAKISCPIILPNEELKETEIPRSTESSGSPDMIVISDDDDDDDEPEIISVEYHPPRKKIGPTFEGVVLNHRHVALPMRNGGTMLISTAQRHTIQIIPPSRWQN